VRVRICSSIVLAALLAGPAGCTSTMDADRPPPGDADTRLSHSVVTTSAEGPRDKVTPADYEAAVRRLAVCVDESGVKLVNDGWDPVDHERMALRYDAPGMPFEKVNAIIERCEGTHLAPVAARYNEDNQSFMSPELMKAVQECLTTRRIGVTGREADAQDLLRAVPGSRHQELRDCVREGVRKIYPGMLGISFP
jgi:hypothetical protein